MVDAVMCNPTSCICTKQQHRQEHVVAVAVCCSCRGRQLRARAHAFCRSCCCCQCLMAPSVRVMRALEVYEASAIAACPECRAVRLDHCTLARVDPHACTDFADARHNTQTHRCMSSTLCASFLSTLGRYQNVTRPSSTTVGLLLSSSFAVLSFAVAVSCSASPVAPPPSAPSSLAGFFASGSSSAFVSAMRHRECRNGRRYVQHDRRKHCRFGVSPDTDGDASDPHCREFASSFFDAFNTLLQAHSDTRTSCNVVDRAFGAAHVCACGEDVLPPSVRLVIGPPKAIASRQILHLPDWSD